jgi:HK97 family phage major capsid protein
MSVKELRDRQAKLVAEARERLDQITNTTDEARAKELEVQHDAAMAEHDRLEKLIEREERQAALEARIEEQRAKQRPAGGDGAVRGQADGEKVEYRAAFYRMIAVGGDVSELTAEERAALRAGVRRDAEFRMQTVGTGTAGGYTVPVELANQIVRSMVAWGPMYDGNLTTEMNTSGGGQIEIPTINDTTVTAEAHTEGTALTDDGGKDAAFGKKQLNAYVFDTEFVKWSFELAQDSIFNIEALLGSLLGERLGRIANLQLTTGTGSSAPNGIVTASSLGKTAASATAITWDEIIDLEHSVDPAYRSSPKARYMFNDNTLAACRKLKDGNGNYLWQAGNVQTGVPATFNGRPYSINQAMDSIAAAKKVMLFGDLGKYWVRKVGSPVIGVMRERFWPDLGIAGLIRFDGELVDTAAVKHLITAAS